MTVQQTRHTNLNEHQAKAFAEYCRRIDDLKQGGFRLAFQSSYNIACDMMHAKLVHANGKVILVTFYPKSSMVCQRTNSKLVYEQQF